MLVPSPKCPSRSLSTRGSSLLPRLESYEPEVVWTLCAILVLVISVSWCCPTSQVLAAASAAPTPAVTAFPCLVLGREEPPVASMRGSTVFCESMPVMDQISIVSMDRTLFSTNLCRSYCCPPLLPFPFLLQWFRAQIYRLNQLSTRGFHLIGQAQAV